MKGMELDDYKQALYSLETNTRWRMEEDLEFLKEIQEHLRGFEEKRDPTRLELAKDMVNDWIIQLDRKLKQ